MTDRLCIRCHEPLLLGQSVSIVWLPADPILDGDLIDMEHAACTPVPAPARVTERQAILDEARQIVSVDRNGAYGEPETNHARIAALWSVYLETPITPRQAALCMALVKIAREIHGPKRDNLVDLAGYAALAGEMP